MDLTTELFRRKKSKEIFAHQVQNAKQGNSNGGKPAYGYQRKEIEVEGKKKVVWELQPEESRIVRQVFSWHLEGNGARKVARRLTKEGYRDRRTKPFAYNSILEWFRNSYRYAGHRCWNAHDNNMKPNPKPQMGDGEKRTPCNNHRERRANASK